MIQLNLLPDVKLEYIKAQRSRRLVLTVSILIGAISIALLVVLLGVDELQKKQLHDLNNNISSETSTLQHKPQINNILTVQNQLESLTALHAVKPAAPRLFNYLNEVTPVQVSISSLSVDFTQQTITITGGADALSSINTYVDTLKYTSYSTTNSTQLSPAFNNVVLTTFGLNNSTQDKSQAATYTITLSYDKNIFDITQTINLTVPSLVTTRTQIDQPTDLFKASANTPKASGGKQ
jgi:Tfp pilus assembly protein PilN